MCWLRDEANGAWRRDREDQHFSQPIEGSRSNWEAASVVNKAANPIWEPHASPTLISTERAIGRTGISARFASVSVPDPLRHWLTDREVTKIVTLGDVIVVRLETRRHLLTTQILGIELDAAVTETFLGCL